jgi:DNA repair exonuclease SbcCD ATPase subunit
MQHIQAFGLKNTLLFKDLKFTIPKGLSVVYGLNRTNGKNSMQANGAGKSSAFASIGEILYEEPIVGLKEDTIKQGTRYVDLLIGKRPVRVSRTNSKLEITSNGKSKIFRKLSDGRAWLKKHLPVTHAEFNTYAFLDARVPHPLVMGSSTERKRFFTEAFGLDRIDVERRLFEAELSKLKRVRAAYSELKTVFVNEKEKALGKEKRLALEEKVKGYEAELKDLNDKAQRLQTIAQVLAFEASASKQVQAFAKLCPDLEEFSSLYDEVQANLKDNRKKLKDAQGWEEYIRDNRKYAEAYANLPEDAKALADKHGVRKALKRCKETSEGLSDLKEKIEKNEEFLASKPKKPKPVEGDVPEKTRKELRAELETLEHRLEHAEKFGTGKCGECGQDVKVKSPKKIRVRMAEVEAGLEYWMAYTDYEDQHKEYSEWKKKAQKIEGRADDLEAQYRKARKANKIGRALRDLPTEPEPFTGLKLEVKVCEIMVNEDRAQLELLEFMEPNLETIKMLRELTEKQRGAASLAPKLQQRITDLHEKLSKARARLEINSMVTSSLKKHKARLLEMKAELKDEEALKLLVAAYSDKAMKKTAIKAISARLMSEVNKYAKLIFPEDFDFGFTWESSKMNLTVTRKYRKGKTTKVLTSDVRKLSGAESKLYTFILVLAHLTFVPSRKRSNVLILDEPDSNMSAETADAFKKLLPILNKVIPSIIVITPRTEQRYDGAQEFTVLKQDGVASIVSGHPSTIK